MLRGILAVILLIGVSVSNANLPRNVYSIKFLKDDVSVDLSIFEEIGEEDVNYLYATHSRVGNGISDSTGAYTLLSHSSQHVMVEVGVLGVNFIIDKTELELESFQADSCTKKELEWLSHAGIVNLEELEIDKISEGFNEDFQAYMYWTKWDTLVHSNYQPVVDSNGVVEWAEVWGEVYPFEFNPPPEEISYNTGVIHSEKRYRNIKSNRFSLDNKEGSTLIDMRGRSVKSLNGDVKGVKSSNIILEYNPEIGVEKHYIGKVK